MSFSVPSIHFKDMPLSQNDYWAKTDERGQPAITVRDHLI